jgi:hypothetical protein
MEQLLWKFIANRYVNKEYIGSGFVEKNRDKINAFTDDEKKRELKNEMLISLLIKFICRYLPNSNSNMENEKIKDKDLFGTIQEKNMNLPQGIQNDLLNLKTTLGCEVKYARELTDYLEGKVMGNKISQKKNEENNNNNEINNEINGNVENENENDEEEQPPQDDDDEGRDL